MARRGSGRRARAPRPRASRASGSAPRCVEAKLGVDVVAGQRPGEALRDRATPGPAASRSTVGAPEQRRPLDAADSPSAPLRRARAGPAARRRCRATSPERWCGSRDERPHVLARREQLTRGRGSSACLVSRSRAGRAARSARYSIRWRKRRRDGDGDGDRAAARRARRGRAARARPACWRAARRLSRR